MRSSLFVVLVAGMLTFFPQVAPCQARFGMSAGLAAPVDDLSDFADVGYNVSAALHFGGTHVPIGARVEAVP